MCGHFGMAGPGVMRDDLLFLQDLAYASGLRGQDGSGICQGKMNGRRLDYILKKSEHEISYFLWSCEFGGDKNKRLFKSIVDHFYIGHVRAATIGSLTKENAHPFEFPNLVGAHNGTLLDNKYNPKHTKKTDSEFFFEDINNNGIIPVLHDLDEKSAYAIVILNKKNGELLFAHNERRPLVFAVNKKRGVMYWASEALMLKMCAVRRGLDIGPVWSFIPDTLYSINPKNIKCGEKIENWGSKARIKKKPKEEEPEPQKSNVVPLIPPQNKNDNKTEIPKRRFDIPCSSCGESLSLVDQWFRNTAVGHNGIVCVECAEKLEAPIVDKRHLN